MKESSQKINSPELEKYKLYIFEKMISFVWSETDTLVLSDAELFGC